MPMLHRVKLLLCSALMPLLVACAASTPFKPSGQTPLPDVRTGEQINLLPVNVVRDKVAAVSAPGGQIHVLIAVTELREVHEVVVSPRGVVARRVVRRNISPWSIAAAFDAVGLLHLMLDDLHLIYSDGNWRAEEQNPWQRLKLEAASPQMVPGGSQLYWYFLVKGEEFGAPTRMELYGFGSYGAGILWPSFTQGVKTVLVKDPPDPDVPLLVLDPAGKMDSHVAGAAADAQGNVYVAYTKSVSGLAAKNTLCFVMVQPELFTVAGGSTEMPDVEAEGHLIRPIVDCLPQPELAVAGRTAWPDGFSVDPQTGMTLIGLQWLVRSGKWLGPLPTPFTGPVKEIRTVAGDDETFHALVIGQPRNAWFGKDFPVYYLQLAGDRWSAPIELGLANTSSFWGWIWDAVAITYTNQGKVFALWPMEHAIVGKWIELKQ